MCLLVSTTDDELTETFAVSSLLAAIAVCSLAVINDIPSRHRWAATAAIAYSIVFVVWMCRVGAPLTGISHYDLTVTFAMNQLLQITYASVKSAFRNEKSGSYNFDSTSGNSCHVFWGVLL